MKIYSFKSECIHWKLHLCTFGYVFEYKRIISHKHIRFTDFIQFFETLEKDFFFYYICVFTWKNSLPLFPVCKRKISFETQQWLRYWEADLNVLICRLAICSLFFLKNLFYITDYFQEYPLNFKFSFVSPIFMKFTQLSRIFTKKIRPPYLSGNIFFKF